MVRGIVMSGKREYLKIENRKSRTKISAKKKTPDVFSGSSQKAVFYHTL
jgi:hypothetical protein